MSTPQAPASPPRSSGPRKIGAGALPPVGRYQGLADLAFKTLCQSAAVLVIVLAALLAGVLLWRASEAFRTFGARFFIDSDWDPAPTHRAFGALAFIWGTVATSLIAMIIAVPLGVGTAVYLAEIAPGKVRRVGSSLVEMLAVIPSVVYGFWGLFVLSPFLQRVVTYFGGPNKGGVGILPAGLILSIMIVPYIAAVSFDVIRAVPRSQREGGLALGATRWQTIWNVMLPYARPGIFGGCFLALGRALGETMAVTMLIGNKAVISLSPLSAGNSIASVIANEFTEATYDLYLSSLVALGVVLLAVSVAFNSAARLLIWRMGRSHSAGAAPRLPLAALCGLLLGLVPALLGLGALLGTVVAPAQVSAGVLWLLAACLIVTVGLVVWRFRRAAAGKELLLSSATPGLCLGLALSAGVLLFGALLRQPPMDAANTEWSGAGVSLVGLGTVVFVLGFAGEVAHLWLSVRQIDRLMTGALALCLAITIGFLLLVLGYLVVQGVTSLNLDFFTRLPRPVGQKGGGMANAMLGSLLMVGMATLFSVPVGLLAAIYLSEYRSGWLGSATRFVAELLGGVPSIVIGIFGYYAVVKPLSYLTDEEVSFCAWAGAFALGVMMIPIVLRAAEEALKLVPQSLRTASFAVGASHWQTIVRVTVPAALPAIITAVFLSIARVAGETAPLLLTAGGSPFWPDSPNEYTASLPVYIFTYAVSPYDDWHRQAWAAALVLLVVVMTLNFGVRLMAGKRVLQASQAD